MLSKYAKMIIALEDPLFDNWMYGYGDNMLVKLNSGDWIDTTFGEWQFTEHTTYKPMPTLMQLQKYSCIPYWDLFLFDIVNRFSNYDTAEEAALACLMYEKYQKKWDGEKWNKIEEGDYSDKCKEITHVHQNDF